MKIVKRAGACALEFWPKRTRACNVRVCDPKICRNSHFASMLQKEFESIVKQDSATKKIDFLRLVQGIEVSTQSGSGFPTCPINIMLWPRIYRQNLFWGKPYDFTMVPKFRISTIIESWIYVGHRINVGPGKFVKKNKPRALNKCRAWKKWAKLCYKKPIKLENICRPWKKFQNLINIGPLIRL